MDVNIIQALLVFIVAFIMGIDQFSFLESLYQPIVLGPIIGAILGNFELGIVVGGAYQLVQIGSMPIGGAQPPNAIMGTIMTAVFAVSMNLEPTAEGVGLAVGLAIPFAVFGQYAVTLTFTIMSGLMAKADKAAEEAYRNGYPGYPVRYPGCSWCLWWIKTWCNTERPVLPVLLGNGWIRRCRWCYEICRIRYPDEGYDVRRNVGIPVRRFRYG